MQTAPTRPWFRWSLRTMFVVVTVVRHAFLYEQRMLFQQHPTGLRAIFSPGQPPSAPGLLWLFGEAGVPALSLIILQDGRTAQDGELRKARGLFPEAKVEYTLVPATH